MASIAVSRLPNTGLGIPRAAGRRRRGAARGSPPPPPPAVHAEVREHHVVILALERGQGLGAARHGGREAALALEVAGEQAHHLGVVVDDEDAGLHAGASVASGIHTVNVVPCPTRLSTPMSPPWALMISRQIASPRPVPWPAGTT